LLLLCEGFSRLSMQARSNIKRVPGEGARCSRDATSNPHRQNALSPLPVGAAARIYGTIYLFRDFPFPA